MTPTGRMLAVTGGWLALAAGAVAWPALAPAWLGIGALGVLVALADGVAARLIPKPEVERRLPGRFALGAAGEVTLVLRNRSPRALQLAVFDGIPPQARAPALPWLGSVPGKREIRISHPVTMTARGLATFGPVHLRLTSPLGLWQRGWRCGEDETRKVYPNYEPVIRFALLAMQHRENPLGIARRSRAGTSREFQQLRDYRDGDPLAQVDWKATSRRQQLVSRAYQEQRNQTIVFLLDTGRRMRAMDGALPQFDHVLNAVLLVSHVALRQGDQVAVKSFGGSNRWLPPVKGGHAMPVLLNHLYDYETTAAASDFREAVEQLMARHRRRALVIVLTNLRGGDGRELVPALRTLRSRHLVMLASMRERVVEDAVAEPVDSFSTALRYLAADRYRLERREILAGLEAHGILTLDTPADRFAAALANSYLDIKAAGRL